MIARVLLISMCVCAATAGRVALGIRNCRNNHANRLNECLMEEIKLLQPHLGGGLPELGLPRLEPLLLDNVEFRQSVPPVTIEAVFRNVMVSGITAFDLKYLDIDFTTTHKLALGMVIPSLTMWGRYRIGGNVFLLPIEGDGDFETILDGVIAEGTGDIVEENSKVVMRNVNIGFKIRSMKTRMENLFQGNQILSDTIHHFLNENGQLVLDEIRPGITAQLNDFIEQLFNSMFSVLPPDILSDIPIDQQG